MQTVPATTKILGDPDAEELGGLPQTSKLSVTPFRITLMAPSAVDAMVLGIPSATFNRITRLDLNFHPYQMIKHLQLLLGDRQRCLQFCQWLLDRPDRFLEDLLIGDEAGFAMNAMVNTHNIRAYRPRGQPPVEFDYQRNNSRLKVTTWVGLMGNGTILGPVFFDENVNGPRYLAMINEQVVPALANERRDRRQGNGRFRRVWWAQDGAPCHRNRATTDRLIELFGERVIALNRPVEWPPGSPELTPLDFSSGAT